MHARRPNDPPLRADRRIRLFVYGTLRSGGGASGLLRGSRQLRTAKIQGTLYDIGGRFPALVLDGEGEVEGEVWACPADRLRELDAYEGVDAGLFRRQRVRVEGEECWTYVAGPRLLPRLGDERVVASGRWPDGAASSRTPPRDE